MDKNILNEIKSNYNFLTKTEKKIADLILSSPADFTKISITELSQSADISQGSINNFSKKFCSGGFTDLKLKIATDYSSYSEKPFSDITSDSAIKTALKKRINTTVQAFDNTYKINGENELKSACEMILSAKRVEIYGVYQSGIVARDLCYQLIQLGIPASYVDDTLMGAVAASMLNADSLVIALSASGQTKDILDAVEIAKDKGSKILSITSNKYSPLSKESDVFLISTNSGDTISNNSNEVRLSQLLLCDTLCAYVRSVIGQAEKEHYYKLQKILNLHSINND
ncbi:MAG: MurR/RpiR family transcriptional regulator [Acutalibacteraceae bacterium]|nr:MurR/RpiR family transcriptional regulator [Acutalibacteraceae bacterium]